ncbi:MAG TPA: tRNA 4-thiouridine(8) synthase ThiI [Kiritimatiellia bacterium]|nr:MAG: thiamine biosynthesis protein ThiI [Verrucomicrobia bacterium ADurb.Bin070]HPB10449.1 tRNA 4-thiouridine(8) synthase ThiI [Kiritimatiellia bacterium]HPO37947.1 tRNA 4-thiouridine(8) synthase ThiI [Kiritimatiellia bacterium]HQL50747.1 tRNA 4-thiouridine(8) synthase ThiI [Kiritimatiellia bacterium]
MESEAHGQKRGDGERRGRGLSLLSGGLDSRLAVCVLREQGLEVEGVVFASPFFKLDSARDAARQLDVPLHVVDFTRDILDLVEHPPHGFGGALNPCIDCHARMIQRAGALMAKMGFDFVATGEVLNQRPMSQNRRSLAIVERDAALSGRLLRPLSALLLEPTVPEQAGVVDRSRLLGLSGRSRKPQRELAERYGLTDYPTPAGGCLLTEKGFCRKLADLRGHEGFGEERLVWLLLRGRHFRLPGGVKCVVGRDARDNAALKAQRSSADVLLHTVDVPGPTALIPGAADDASITRAAGLCAAYADCGSRPAVTIRMIRGETTEEQRVAPLTKEQVLPWML